ncbi:hypothetical protein [Actinacidiphila yeochonensis]|uniref:hypothetical protein n=1 Tax=Actinacidiphila yeochonensis TaxID=89050 RepID=UPI0012FEF74E|nr:hypothetical protein [Actinacidiphila yeochonensis]
MPAAAVRLGILRGRVLGPRELRRQRRNRPARGPASQGACPGCTAPGSGVQTGARFSVGSASSGSAAPDAEPPPGPADPSWDLSAEGVPTTGAS